MLNVHWKCFKVVFRDNSEISPHILIYNLLILLKYFGMTIVLSCRKNAKKWNDEHFFENLGQL